MTITEIEQGNREIADWIEAALETLPGIGERDAHWFDRVHFLAEHIRQGRVGNPHDAFNEIEEIGR